LVSLRDAGEFYLLTTYAAGRPYAEDLRRIAHAGQLGTHDTARVETLARYLVELHSVRVPDPPRYVRAVRDLVGSGEGIFGLTDSYSRDVAGAPPARLHAIERRALEWRWRLSRKSERLARAHGDFHPFNVLFTDEGELSLLDTSRGSIGEPADDVTCMAINYVFFALERPASWQHAFSKLWYRYWSVYLSESGDSEILELAAPFLAWRALVLASPAWYPAVTAEQRDRLLGLIERALDTERFDPRFAEQCFG
jgi:aminoglycoside phosphotransferase (APT) family kinase protein